MRIIKCVIIGFFVGDCPTVLKWLIVLSHEDNLLNIFYWILNTNRSWTFLLVTNMSAFSSNIKNMIIGQTLNFMRKTYHNVQTLQDQIGGLTSSSCFCLTGWFLITDSLQLVIIKIYWYSYNHIYRTKVMVKMIGGTFIVFCLISYVTSQPCGFGFAYSNKLAGCYVLGCTNLQEK